jgi:iron complex transport system substrate-binding protein
VQEGKLLLTRFNKEMASLPRLKKSQKVLFIYARGAGSLMVAGKKTSVDAVISLSGAKNALTSFEDFKPLTAESLVLANPDIILMFNSGVQSLGGLNGLVQVQGLAQTNAGKNKRIIEMDGQLLTGFGPRLPLALKELIEKMNAY